VQSDKSDLQAPQHGRDRHVVLEEEDRNYDSRQTLRFGRGLLDPRAAEFRRRAILENQSTDTKDQTTWNVRCRVLGGGGEFFFPLQPSLVVRRPVYRVFLNLRKDRRSAWTQVSMQCRVYLRLLEASSPSHARFVYLYSKKETSSQRLPPNWRDIDIRIAFSSDFAEDVGLQTPPLSSSLRSELQDQLGREEFHAHVSEIPGLIPVYTITGRTIVMKRARSSKAEQDAKATEQLRDTRRGDR